MFGTLKKIAFAATLGLGLAAASTASATSITFDLRGIPSTSLTEGGETLDITAVALGPNPTLVTNNAVGVGAGLNGAGFSSRVDVGETLTFSFSAGVQRITSITFERAPGEDVGQILDGANNVLLSGPISRATLADPQFITESVNLIGNTFVFTLDSAVSGASGVRISEIVVSTVIPLPAGGILLLAGLGGLAFVRRRKTA